MLSLVEKNNKNVKYLYLVTQVEQKKFIFEKYTMF